jgi:hypothetical protein
MLKDVWDVAPCGLVEINRRFSGAHCFHHQGDEWSALIALMMEAVSTSETSVDFYQTTKRNIPKDSNLHIVALRT